MFVDKDAAGPPTGKPINLEVEWGGPRILNRDNGQNQTRD